MRFAHRVLDNIRRNHVSCQAERGSQSAHQVLGIYQRGLQAASKEFGEAKVGEGVAACQEVPEPHSATKGVR